MIACPISVNAEFVLVSRECEPQILQPNMGILVEYLHKFQDYAKNAFLNYASFNSVLIPLRKVDRTISVDFECVRYVYDQVRHSFFPFEFQTAKTDIEFHMQSRGLSTNESIFRRNLTGPNEILFIKEDILQMLWDEFSGIFYLYQYLMLIIWYYFAYYYMAAVLTVVIVLSGVLKVLVSSEQQKKVLRMATYKDKCIVLRDGEWMSLDSRELVMGKLLNPYKRR